MKFLNSDFKSGTIEVIPQDSEDLYILFNLITPGDLISSKTSRKVKLGSEDDIKSVRISAIVELEVLETEFYGFGESIRVKGLIKNSNEENIGLGTHHAINIELFKSLKITKESWSSFNIEQLKNAQLGETKGLIIVVLDDESAMVAQVGSYASKILVELDSFMTRKSFDPNQYEMTKLDYFKKLGEYLKQLETENLANLFIIGGPGFIKEDFSEFIKNNYPSLDKISKIVSINSIGRSGIQEIIKSHIPDNLTSGKDAKIQAELLQQFLEEIGKNSGLIAYASDVNIAAEYGSIDTLLILDEELHKNVERRKEIDLIIKKVKESGGKVVIMSSMHQSGEILKNFGGIAAILRFKFQK